MTEGINGVVVLGSARSDGHTRLMVDQLASLSGMPVVDLNDYEIGFFEYDNYDRGDDFLDVVQEILKHELIVFATPVYWYSMSAVMKNFFDRITDLLREHKDLGRQLRTKSMAVLSCSASPESDEDFDLPFKKTANYLGMRYVGHLSTWTYQNVIGEDVQKSIEVFSKQLPTKMAVVD